MQISKNSWHYRVYSWFTDLQPESVNLCPYVRTVFLWAPARFLFGDGKIGRLYVAAVVWPIVAAVPPLALWLSGHHRISLEILYVYGIVAISIGFAFICATGIPYLLRRSKKRREAYLLSQMTASERLDFKYYGLIPDHLQSKRFTAIKQGWHLLCEYASAAHDKVCPLLKVEE